MQSAGSRTETQEKSYDPHGAGVILFEVNSCGDGVNGDATGDGRAGTNFNPSGFRIGCSFSGTEFGNGAGEGRHFYLDEDVFEFEHVVTNAALTLTWRRK